MTATNYLIERKANVIVGAGNKFLVFSILYGSFAVNWIDLQVIHGTNGFYFPWLFFMYWAPFIFLLILSKENWRLFVGYGLLVSLMNDLFYYPVSVLMFGHFVKGTMSITSWYFQQLGGYGGSTLWTMHFTPLLEIQITSLIMGLSIVARIFLTVVLLRGHKRKKQDLVVKIRGMSSVTS